MAHDLRALVGRTGVVRSAELARRVDRHTVARWVQDGRLLRPHPGVLVLPELADDWRARTLAAVLATGGALSHVSALAFWQLAPRAGRIHVSVPYPKRARGSRDLVVHRVTSFDPDRVGGIPVIDLVPALVDTWALAYSGGDARDVELARAAVITALRDERIRASDLRREVSARRTLPGRRGLVTLIDLVDGGCQSELEIWGVLHVFRGPGMPRFVQQHRVVLPHGTVKLDVALPELMIAVELDGAAFHGSASDRERDTRRDAALSARGWVVLRFSYRRLTTDPEGCRREIRQVVATRRAQLAAR